MLRLGAALMAICLLPACQGRHHARVGSSAGAGPPPGRALDDKTVQNGSVIQLNDVRVGQVYQFSFPRLTNVSNSPLVVTSVHMAQVPSGVTLLGYPEFTVTAASGYPLNQRFDFPGNRAEPEPFSGPIVIRPGETSPHIFMVSIRLKHRGSGPLQGCVLDYTQNKASYRQYIDCHFAFGA